MRAMEACYHASGSGGLLCYQQPVISTGINSPDLVEDVPAYCRGVGLDEL